MSSLTSTETKKMSSSETKGSQPTDGFTNAISPGFKKKRESVSDAYAAKTLSAEFLEKLAHSSLPSQDQPLAALALSDRISELERKVEFYQGQMLLLEGILS